ncbi:MAG: type II secretion system F family protein [Acidimicrobiia bacterium]|nr:type II secretion system F family protein [Acidimicrobiia bacterium]
MSVLPLQDLPAETVEVVPRAGLTESGDLLWIGAVSLSLAVVIVASMVLTQRNGRPVDPKLRGIGLPQGPTAIEALRDALLRRLERVIRTDARQDAARRLERAGLRIQVGELVMMSIATVLLFAGIGYMWRQSIGSLIGIGTALLLPRLYVDHRARRRKAAFEAALPDVLSSIANVLRVGFSLNVGLGTVAKEYDDPISSELERALAESRVSGSIISALGGVADRMDSVDLRWVNDAIEINSTVGGDLVEVLENVAATIRSRARLNAQVSALTAEARMSALVLFMLPPGLAAFIALTNPEYFDGIWGTSLTYLMVGSVAFMLIVGGLWIRKMINAAVL